MGQLITFLRGCFLSSFALIHLNVSAFPLQKKESFSLEDTFKLPDWIVKETVFDQLSWQGLPMKIEFFNILKLQEEFFIELASVIPEGSVMTKTPDGYQVSWIMNRISYVLLVEDKSSSEIISSKGILSSIELRHDTDTNASNSRVCSMRWLPDDVQLIFSMGDKVGGVNQARIDGYISVLGFNEVRSIIVSRLKQYGWVSLAEYPQRSQLGPSTVFEAFCGNRHARIDLQKQSFQTRISVMSIEQ